MTQVSRWKLIVALVVIFGAGIVTGVYLPRAIGRRGPWGPHGGDFAAHLKTRLTQELSLDAKQTAALDPIADEAATDLQRLRTEADERVLRAMQTLNDKLRPILTPEQVTKLEALEKSRREMVRGRRPRL